MPAVLSHRHRQAAAYYRKSAFITTEQRLIDTFMELAAEREQFARELSNALSGESHLRPKADTAVAHMGKIWRRMKTALIINVRRRIVSHVRETEKAALKRTRRILLAEEIPPAIRTLLQHQASRLEQSVARLEVVGKRNRRSKAA